MVYGAPFVGRAGRAAEGTGESAATGGEEVPTGRAKGRAEHARAAARGPENLPAAPRLSELVLSWYVSVIAHTDACASHRAPANSTFQAAATCGLNHPSSNSEPGDTLVCPPACPGTGGRNNSALTPPTVVPPLIGGSYLILRL